MKRYSILLFAVAAAGCMTELDDERVASCVLPSVGTYACYEVPETEHLPDYVLELRVSAGDGTGAFTCAASNASEDSIVCPLDADDAVPSWLFSPSLAPPVGSTFKRVQLCNYHAIESAHCDGALTIYQDGTPVWTFEDPPAPPFYYETSEPLTRLGL